jgi:hypothetical protein
MFHYQRDKKQSLRKPIMGKGSPIPPGNFRKKKLSLDLSAQVFF